MDSWSGMSGAGKMGTLKKHNFKEVRKAGLGRRRVADLQLRPQLILLRALELRCLRVSQIEFQEGLCLPTLTYFWLQDASWVNGKALDKADPRY